MPTWFMRAHWDMPMIDLARRRIVFGGDDSAYNGLYTDAAGSRVFADVEQPCRLRLCHGLDVQPDDQADGVVEGLTIATDQPSEGMRVELDVWPHGTMPVLASRVEEELRVCGPCAEGSGVIRKLVFHPGRGLAIASAAIRIWWDGRTEPDIDCPMGLLFQARAPQAWECDIPMPFWRGFRIECEASGQMEVHVGANPWTEAQAGRFCARPASQIPGCGHLVSPNPGLSGFWGYETGRRTPGGRLCQDSDMPFVGGLVLVPEVPAPTMLWYQTDAFALRQTDRFDPCDPESRRSHHASCKNESDVFQLGSCFEGPVVQSTVVKTHRSHLNRLAFDAEVSPEAEWLIIRKWYDQFHGRQRARVHIDGLEVGVWYLPQENRACRWAERDLVIAPKFFRGKNRVRIEIDPPPGTPLWDAAEYQVLVVEKV